MRDIELDNKTKIANPLYDVVFRYMMEDNKVAKLFLSAVIDEDIEELVFNPTEYSRKLHPNIGITLIRMDFSAKIRLPNGEMKLVIIELQKAKYYYQTMRFRRYLGKQYENPENVDKANNPIPIYPIYILGDAFTERIIPVIKVKRDYIDMATNECLEYKHPFIEALTHDAIVIQVPHLKKRRQTVLEQFLSIFDQSNQIDARGHLLALNVNDYPERYHAVIKRLHKAILSPQLEEDMDVEDEVINEFHKKSKAIAALEQENEEVVRKFKEAEQKIQETKQEIQETKQQVQEKEKQIEQAVKALAKVGTPIPQIAQMFSITIEDVKNIIQ